MSAHMDFAEKQLLKYGWTRGQGLGKKENGIPEPIRVKLKRDSSGVGSVPGADFTSNWWDKVFNSAANNIRVTENDEGGVSIEAEADTSLSRKNRHYDQHKKQLSYGGFLQSTSVQCSLDKTGEEGKETMSKGKGADLEEGAGRKLRGEKRVGMTDELLFEACGGRTAHKGARHGLTLSGKLARIELQEQAAALAQGSKVIPKRQKKLKEEQKKLKDKRHCRDAKNKTVQSSAS